MIFIENGVFEFIWLWVAWFWPLPLLFRVLPPVDRSIQALRVLFFHRISVLPKSGISAGKNLKVLLLAGLVWSLIVLAALRTQWVWDPGEFTVAGRIVMLAVELSGR